MSFIKQVLATITGILITSIILFFLFLVFIGVLVQQSSQPTTVVAPAKSVLYLSLDYKIVEKTESNPLGDLNLPLYNVEKSIGLNDVLARIKAAKTDENIKGIYLNPSTVGMGFASLKAIRDALLDFKESKKFIIAYSEGYSQKAYYLSTVADSVYLNPQGSLDFRGLSSSVVFMKEAMDKLGVEMQVIKVGTYKSAVEPFILNEMSDANREQVTSYLGSIYNSFLADISQARKQSVDSLKSIANEYLIRNADDALRYKFIDGKIYKDELLSKLKKRLDLAEDKDISSVSILNYGGSPASTSGGKIAVLYAYGDIVDGEGSMGQIGGDKISRELRKLRRDKDIKAVVLRVNSGGGSALASDIIWREVELIKKEKPIVVSMGDYAASGGYYIAAAADSIFAESTTLTGSIGVFGLIPNFKGLLNNKLGIHIDEVSTGKFSSLMGNPDKPLTAEERSIIQMEVNRTYSTFMERVANGRKMNVQAVDSIGQGRVWTGQQALELGLVDAIGNLQRAVASAATKADLKDYQIVELPEKTDPFASILSSSKDRVKMWLFGEELGDYQKYLLDVTKVLKHTGIQARLPYQIEIY
ncbi:signal peptide peptidase SppA [Sphingobacterium faecale]|uniref:Signal peptide peptidase SppA n=1 Tax=Sphingobacterium faecale TaxID=2803775 RepID=A0ABS1R5Q8_9SPHI|nr:signal peptide peptidase SppA [Sphingobacterium faecale]MBL1409889.1 signal peptide peptidase SppA [Sphingobacterium faecale]